MKVILLVLMCLTSFSVVAKDLIEVLAQSEPVEEGICRVPTTHGIKLMDCIRGQRDDGVNIYAIKQDGKIIAVYEQVGDAAPKQIWGDKWQDL